MKNFTLVILFLILFLIFGIIGYLRHQEFPGSIKFEFSSGPCDIRIDPYNQSNLGIKEIKWLNNTTLQVKAYVSINCAEKIEAGYYKINGDKITLIYKSPTCRICAECMCAHELTYKFFNLEKKDYQFELKRIE